MIYKKDKENVLADCVSRLPTFGYSTVDVDTALQVFVLSDDPNTVSRRTDVVDTSIWASNNWDPDDLRKS